jgi:hypothetical protein
MTAAAATETFECGLCRKRFGSLDEFDRHRVLAHDGLAAARREHQGCWAARACHCMVWRLEVVASELREEDALLHLLFRLAGRSARTEARIPAPRGTFEAEVGARLVSEGYAFWLNGDLWLSEAGFRRAGMRWG